MIWIIEGICGYMGLKIERPRMELAAQVAKFIISGGTAALANFLTLFILTEYARIWYLYSAVISYVIGFTVSFVLYKYWAFDDRDNSQIYRQLPQYLLIAAFNLALNTALVYLLVRVLHTWYLLAQIVATGLIAIESYLIFRKIFKPS